MLFTWKIYFVSRGTKESQSVLARAISQVTLIQKNQYAQMAYFEATCSPFLKKEINLKTYLEKHNGRGACIEC